MENPDFKKESEGEGAEEVYSKAVRAGRRTYFFDVKATRNDDYYITVTESRKKTGKDGGFTFEKHKIYLYKEDFRKFAEGFQDAVDYVVKSKPECFNPDGTAIVPAQSTGRTVRQTVTVSERWPLRGLPFLFGTHATETELDSLSGPKRRPGAIPTAAKAAQEIKIRGLRIFREDIRKAETTNAFPDSRIRRPVS